MATTRSFRILVLLLCFAATSACTTTPANTQAQASAQQVETQANTQAACPWRGAEADSFSGPTDPAATGFQPRIVASGHRGNNGDVAALLKQSADCGWTPNLKSVAKSDDGAAFEIELVRQ